MDGKVPAGGRRENKEICALLAGLDAEVVQ
jgi:hypothetical protein